jgi:hypothetical protein
MPRIKLLLQKFLGAVFVGVALPLSAAQPVFASHGVIELAQTGDHSPVLHPDYWGTQMERLEMGEMATVTLVQMRIRHPELKPETPITIHVRLIKDKPGLFVSATGSDAKYTQAYLDLLMEEFVKFHSDASYDAIWAIKPIESLLLAAEKRVKECEERQKQAEEPGKPAALAKAWSLKKALAQECFETLKKKMVELNEIAKAPSDLIIKEHATPAEEVTS